MSGKFRKRNLWKEDSEKENVAIGASFDMGWQKRGKAHDSLTGTLQILHMKEFEKGAIGVCIFIESCYFFLSIVL